MIEIEGLTVRFGEFHAVRDASFRVEAGEAFGLVGEFGLGQDHGAEGDRRPPARLARPDHGRRRGAGRPAQRQLLPQGADDLPGPLRLAAPPPHGRSHARRAGADPSPGRRRRPGRAGAARGRARARLPLPLPASALGRPAPAGRDRARADARARGAAARRADLLARRLGPGRDPEPAERAARRARPDLSVRLAQPRGDRAHVLARSRS